VTLASLLSCILCRFFFFNDPATTEIYTLSLHDALPISRGVAETARRSIVALERALSGPRVGRSGVEVVQAVNVARGGVGVGGAPPGSARLGEAVRDSLGVAPVQRGDPSPALGDRVIRTGPHEDHPGWDTGIEGVRPVRDQNGPVHPAHGARPVVRTARIRIVVTGPAHPGTRGGEVHPLVTLVTGQRPEDC